VKLPTLWLVAAFAAGIGAAARWPAPVAIAAVASAAAIAIAAALLWRKLETAAWICTLAAWCALGSLAANIERTDVPANHITRLIAAGRIDTNETLRWSGRLREDPAALTWGHRYEIALENVEQSGEIIPVAGGLRLSLYREPRDSAALPDFRAGDRVEALVKARPPRNFLDPGAFDLRAYLARQSIDLTGSLRSAELLQRIGQPQPTLPQRLARLRGALLARLDALFPDQPARAAVLRAMLLGDRSFVDSDVVTAFQKTSAYHVLVVAGLHVGALVVFLFWFCRTLRFPMGVTTAVTLVALAAYLGVVQDRPPILRAALMAALYLCARPLFRRVDLLNTIAFAALALLVWKPSSLLDSSFQLSFLAAGVIAGLALPWMARTSAPYRQGLRHLGDVTRDAAHPPKVAQLRVEMRLASRWLAARTPPWLGSRAAAVLTLPVRAGLRLWEIILLSAVIQWGMMPLLARDFHRVSLLGPVSNIPAVMLTGIIVPLGFLALVFSFIWTKLALAVAKIVSICAGWLLASVGWFSRVPRVSYRIPDPPAWLILLFFAAFIVLAAAARAAAARRTGRLARRQLSPPITSIEWASAFSLAALAILVASHPFRANLAGGKLEVSVLDVGQGDSIFVAFPDRRTMLVDGGGLSGSEWIGGYRSGNDVGEEVVSPYLWSRGIKRIDVVALTHGDHDHMDGLNAVLANFQVGELWIGREDDRPGVQRLLEEARARGVAIVRKSQGDSADWDGAQASVLWPPKPTGERLTPNDASLVLRLSDGGAHFLLTGDIEKKTEEQLIADHQPLAADFLKVAHHGSKTSSSDDFLSAVAPRFAAASVGESNPFGHPAEAIVERYAAHGVRLLRTDRDGAITLLTDGNDLSLQTYAETAHAN
jgi:competence protein ComEC